MGSSDFVIIGSDPISKRYFIHERQDNNGQPGKVGKMADGAGDVNEVCKHYIEQGYDPSKIIINGQPATDVFQKSSNNEKYETNLTIVKDNLAGIVNDKVLDLKKSKEESSFFNHVYHGVLASGNNGSMSKQEVNVQMKSFRKFEGNVGKDEFNLRAMPAILSGGLKISGTVNGEEVNFNMRNVTKEEWDKHADIYAILAGANGLKVDFDDNGKAVCSLTRTKRENIQKQAVMQQVQNQQAQLMNDQINQINQQIQMDQMNQLAVNNANMMTFGHI